MGRSVGRCSTKPRIYDQLNARHFYVCDLHCVNAEWTTIGSVWSGERFAVHAFGRFSFSSTRKTGAKTAGPNKVTPPPLRRLVCEGNWIFCERPTRHRGDRIVSQRRREWNTKFICNSVVVLTIRALFATNLSATSDEQRRSTKRRARRRIN